MLMVKEEKNNFGLYEQIETMCMINTIMKKLYYKHIKKAGLRESEFFILSVLYNRDGYSRIIDIVRKTGLEETGVRKIIPSMIDNNLINAKYIKKSNRIQGIKISKQGIEILNNIKHYINAEKRKLIYDIDDVLNKVYKDF